MALVPCADASVPVLAVNERSKYQAPAVWIPMRDGACCGPVRVRFDWIDARLGETLASGLLGPCVREVQAQLLVGVDRDGLVGLNELKGQRRVGKAEDRPFGLVTTLECLEKRQPHKVPVEADRLLVLVLPARKADGSDARQGWRP